MVKRVVGDVVKTIIYAWDFIVLIYLTVAYG
jgi:hypothetical protein